MSNRFQKSAASEGTMFREKEKSTSKDVQTLFMIKFWDRHRCGMEEVIVKRFTGLKVSWKFLITWRMGLPGYSEKQIHACVHWHLVRERRKLDWCWGPVKEFAKVKDIQGHLLTQVILCGWHKILIPPQLLSWVFWLLALQVILRALLAWATCDCPRSSNQC